MSFLKLKTNIPVAFVLEYDSPYKPEPHEKYGQSYSYKFASPLPGGEDVWSATEQAHELIQALGLKKGDAVNLVKEEIEGTSAKRFRINGKIMDDFKEDFKGMTVAEAQGDVLPVLIGKFDEVLSQLKEFANTRGGASDPPTHEEGPPSYDEKPPLYQDDQIPF